MLCLPLSGRTRETNLQSAHDLRLDQQFTSQHDSDPKHVARTTLAWLQDKCLIGLEWPS